MWSRWGGRKSMSKYNGNDVLGTNLETDREEGSDGAQVSSSLFDLAFGLENNGSKLQNLLQLTREAGVAKHDHEPADSGATPPAWGLDPSQSGFPGQINTNAIEFMLQV